MLSFINTNLTKLDNRKIKLEMYLIFMLLNYLVINLCTGFTKIALRTSLSTDYVTKTCNRTWQFTENIQNIIIPDKSPESNDNCYCVLYHPTNQQLLVKLILHILLFDKGTFSTTWHRIYVNQWATDHYKVPVFHVAVPNNGSRNLFYTHVYHGRGQHGTFVPVKISFEEIGGKFSQAIHLSCSPDGYALPDILKRKPATTSSTMTTLLPDTTTTENNLGKFDGNNNTSWNASFYDISTETIVQYCNYSDQNASYSSADSNICNDNTALVAVLTCLFGILIGAGMSSLIFYFYIRNKILQLSNENDAYLKLDETRNNNNMAVAIVRDNADGEFNNVNNSTLSGDGHVNIGYTDLNIDGQGYSIANFPDEAARESNTDSVQYEQVDAYLDPVSSKTFLENDEDAEHSVTNPEYI